MGHFSWGLFQGGFPKPELRSLRSLCFGGSHLSRPGRRSAALHGCPSAICTRADGWTTLRSKERALHQHVGNVALLSILCIIAALNLCKSKCDGFTGNKIFDKTRDENPTMATGCTHSLPEEKHLIRVPVQPISISFPI